MKKLTSWIVTFLIILSQFLPAAQIVIAESNKVFFNVNEAFDSNNQATKLQIEKKKEVETDRIEITLPSQVEFFEELSETKDATLSYKANENKIVLEEIGDSFNDFSLVLKNYDKINSIMTIESYLSGDKLNSQKYTLKNISKNDSIQETAQPKEFETIEPLVGDLNTDLSIESMKDTIESGTVAQYKMILKLTGSKKQYQNAKLEVQLPVNEYVSFNEEEQKGKLDVAGITPTFNKDLGTLEYDFSNLDEGVLSSGQTYERVIRLDTKNGITPNDTKLEAVAKFTSNDTEYIEDKASVLVKASAAVALSKKFTGEVWEVDKWGTGVLFLPKKDRITKWKIAIEVPKKETGQLYLNDKEYIEINDFLPKDLVFEAIQLTNEEYEYITDEHKLKIKLPVPSTEDQSSAQGSLYRREFEVWLRIDKNTTEKKLINKVESNVEFVGSENIKNKAEDKLYVYPEDLGQEPIDGSFMLPFHLGPTQEALSFEKMMAIKTKAVEEGNESLTEKELEIMQKYLMMDDIPFVYEDARLAFNHDITALNEGVDEDYQNLSYFYEIGNGLDLQQLRVPGEWYFLPEYSEDESMQKLPLNRDPEYKIYGYVEGKERLLVDKPIPGKIYNRDELSLSEEDYVTKLEYRFSYAPKGLYSTPGFFYEFSIVPGFIGETWNYLSVKGTTGKGDPVNYSKEYFDAHVYPGARGVEVVKPDYSLRPLAIVAVELNDHNNGEVTLGDNRMKVRLSNRSASPAVMTEDLISVVMLPPGVKLKQNPNPSYNNKDGGDYEVIENYNNSGRDLIRIKWNQRLLSEGQDLIAELDVQIVESNSTQLKFDVYGYSGDEHIGIPEKQGDTLTDTKLGIDKENLLGVENPNSNQPRLESGNLYRIAGQYDLQSQKFIKKSASDEWTKDIQKVLPGESIDYKLSMTNSTKHTFKSMVLMDVLPSVGDLGITDNIQRGSQFTPNLNGPIEIPTEWAGKVDVLYSTSKNPKRDDLIKNTNYPEGTTQLDNPEDSEDPNWMTETEVTNWAEIHSFKIEMKSEESWLPGENMDVFYQVTAPSCDDIANGIADIVKLDDIEINQSNDVITVLDKEYRLNNILNKAIPKEHRLTSNSFAIATDHGQPVEPKHVDFYMEIDSSLKIKKVDEKDQTPLAGAEFELYDSEGRKITLSQKLVTDKTGELFVEGLKPGKYKLKEIKAPKGYTLLTKDIDFEIACDNEDNELIITNSKQGWDLPSTGGIGTIIFYIVGLVIMGFAGYKWVSRKDKVKPN